MNPLLLYSVTPILGFLRNYIKYKQCKFITFMRTPLVYFFFHSLFCLMDYRNVVWKTLIFERWYFFIDKSIMSLWNNDYMKKKDKYKIKYGLQYKNDKSDKKVKKVTFKED